MADMADVRQRRRKAQKKKRSEDEEGEARRPKQLVRQHRGISTAAPRKGKVALELPCTIRTFSEAAGVPTAQVLRTLMGMGMGVANVNVQLDPNLAQSLAMKLGVELEFKQQATLEETLPGGAGGLPRRSRASHAKTSRGDLSGPRRSRQDVAARQDHRHQCRGRRSGRHHAAHSRVSDRDQGRPRTSRSSIRRVTKRSPRCGPAGRTSPTSRCWWSRPTTASCRRPKKRSATPRRPTCRSSWR